MRIDIVIPAYNEEAIIADSVTAIAAVTNTLGFDSRIVVADNGSTDQTAQHAQAAGAHVLTVPARGKGAALIYAAQFSTAERFAFIDADLSAEPTELVHLAEVLEVSGVDIVIGSRLVDTSSVNRSWLRTMTSQAFNVLARVLLGIRVRDTQCGLKVMNEKGRRVLASCAETGWFLDLEFLARANQAGLTIREVPIVWQEFRFPGRSSKLRLLRDGFEAVFAMLRIRRTLS